MDEQACKIGRHEMRLEPPDIVYVCVVGDVSEDETVALLTRSDQWAAERDHQFWLVDVRQLGHIQPGARRRAASWPLSASHWGTVAFGVGFTQQLLARMLFSAAKFLRGEHETVMLLSTQEEARAWIAAERQRRQARRA